MLFLVITYMLIDDSYTFVEDLSIYYRKYYGHLLCFGRLDRAGNFVPLVDAKVIDTSKAMPKSFGRSYVPLMMSRPPSKEVYEFRSGRLIPGSIRDNEFAPDVDGKVISFSDYKYSENARRIFNLPGKFVPKTNAGNKPSPDEKVPGKTTPLGTPSDQKATTKPQDKNEDYVFNLTPTVEYSRRFGNYLYFGTLDEYGNFKPSITESPIDVSKGEPKSVEKYIPLMSHIKQKEVYEFRFRTLIPGVIENGEFLPDLDGKIIDFADYQYSKTAKPIYNLPGKFVLVPKK